MSIPTPEKFAARWTVADRFIPPGGLVWYRWPNTNPRVQRHVVAAVIDGYGSVRVRLRFLDPRGVEQLRYVNTEHVYVRFEGEAEA